MGGHLGRAPSPPRASLAPPAASAPAPLAPQSATPAAAAAAAIGPGCGHGTEPECSVHAHASVPGGRPPTESAKELLP